MKLYRGLKGDTYLENSPDVEKRFQAGWRKVLAYRSKGNFDYPEHLSDTITELARLERLTRQHFTDHPDIARSYAKKHGGVLVEIDVSIEDIFKYFIIEFQNYAKRRQQFEVTYLVQSKHIRRNKKKWKLRVKKI